VAIIILALVFAIIVPKFQHAAVFTFTSQSSNRSSNVIVVNATVENTGNAAGGCTVYAQVTDTTTGGYWTQSKSVYLEVGASQAIGFQFGNVPTSDQYTWSVSTTPPAFY